MPDGPAAAYRVQPRGLIDASDDDQSQPDASEAFAGGADLLATRTVQSLNPAFDPRTKLNEGLRDCAQLANQPIATAIDRNQVRANYACGVLFALVAEKVSRGDFYAFVRNLIAANHADREVSLDEWLTALARAGGTQAQVTTIHAMVERGTPQPSRQRG